VKFSDKGHTLFYKLADHQRFTDLSVELREEEKMYF